MFGEVENGEEGLVGEVEVRDVVDGFVRLFVVVEEVFVRGDMGGIRFRE